MSEADKKNETAAKMAAPDADAQHTAAALLARLSGLETEAPPLSDAQTDALYRRTLQKAGLCAADAPALCTGEAAEPPATAPEKKKLIRWQRLALSAAAALAVIALGGTALVRGGFGVAMDSAAEQCVPETAMDMAAQEPTETAPELFDDAEPAETVQEKFAVYNKSSEFDSVGESAAYGCTTADEAPERLLMADGRLYRAAALTVKPDADGGDRTLCIESVIPAGQTPAEDGQANFDAVGVPYIHWGSGLAVLLDGAWVYFEPVK